MKDNKNTNKNNEDRIVISGNYSLMGTEYPDLSAFSLDPEIHKPDCSAPVKKDEATEMKSKQEKINNIEKAKSIIDEECDLPIYKITENIKTIVRCSCFLQDEQDEADIERVTNEVLADVFDSLSDIVTSAKEREGSPHFVVFTGECRCMDGIAFSFGIKLNGRSDSPKAMKRYLKIKEEEERG